MTQYGALDNANLGTWRGSGLCVMTPLTLPNPGTLTEMSAYIRDQGSNDDYRYGVYQGGTLSSILGAALIWDSGLQAAPSSGTGAFDLLNAGDPAVTAGVTWLCVQCDSSADVQTVTAADGGDMEEDVYFWLTGQGILAGGFPSVAPVQDGRFNSNALKAFVEITENTSLDLEHLGGGQINLQGQNHEFEFPTKFSVANQFRRRSDGLLLANRSDLEVRAWLKSNYIGAAAPPGPAYHIEDGVVDAGGNVLDFTTTSEFSIGDEIVASVRVPAAGVGGRDIYDMNEFTVS